MKELNPFTYSEAVEGRVQKQEGRKQHERFPAFLAVKIYWSPQEYTVNAQTNRQIHGKCICTHPHGTTYFAELWEHLSFGKVTIISVKTLLSQDSSL